MLDDVCNLTAGAEKNLHKLRQTTDLAVLPVRYVRLFVSLRWIACVSSSLSLSSSCCFDCKYSALHKMDIDSVARTLRWMMENYAKLTKSS